jgi:hypothetical protein
MKYVIEVSASKKFVVEVEPENERIALSEAVGQFNGTPSRCLDITVTVLEEVQ